MISTWIEYLGHKILYMDYRKLTDKQMLDDMRLVYKMMHDSPGNMLVLLNTQGSFPAKVFLSHYKLTSKTEDARKIAKFAVVAKKTGVMEILLNEVSTSTGYELQFFDAEDQAKHWLIA
ncbi:MAG: STAS/SEC14 domain-containing protein [Syntrophaceae bacterium]